jgi:hypothetical protein
VVLVLLMAALLIPTAAMASGTAFVRPQDLAPGQPPAGASSEGALPGNQQIEIKIVLPPSHGSDLQDLLHNLYEPGSPEFHQWLPSGRFIAQFGPSASSVSAVESWLHGVGLSDTSSSGFDVAVQAPASKVASALGTSFERFRTPAGRQGYVAQSTPLVPGALSDGQVSTILGLNTIEAVEPQNTLVPSPRSSVGAAVVPHADGLTPCSSAVSEAGHGYYTLDSLGADYGLDSLLSDGQDGSGQVVGLFELASHSSADITTYENCFGLTNPITTDTVDGGGGAVGGSGTVEADIDIEQAATQAPGAAVISYEGPNTYQGQYDTWDQIVTTDAAQVISTSWSQCEPLAALTGAIPAFTTLFEAAAAQGQTVLAASGDSGSEGCYAADSSTSEQVGYPSSDAWVTAVGGTTLLSPGNESAWNECLSDESTACANSLGKEGAGGGGLSRYEPRLSYQPTILYWSSAQSCGQYCREVPDISANAAVGMVVYANGSWTAEGGTSLAAPLLAGLVADRNQGCASLTGVWTPALYALSTEGAYGSALTDITAGNTDLTGSNGGAYSATTGYDAATGLGSPLAAGLSCPEITSVGSGYSGSQTTISGLGLEHATITFGGTTADVVSATATSATVVVPQGSGTVTVAGSSVLGTGVQTSSFTYGASPPPPSTPPPAPPAPPQHGYWLVGGDGGIFTFGSAQFHGSTGSLRLQRPVVGITPTNDHGGYWLVASDGGIFAFGDAGFYGSIPGLGYLPAGTPGNVKRLNAPVVGMVPSADGGGYFMVASDGGVFAFGAARFEGSCPGIGGCSGPAVAVMPDATGNGYWLVTATGHVYTFGDATYFGAPGPEGTVTSAVRTPDGRGYWILFSNGHVAPFGDATNLGGLPAGATAGVGSASAIFSTADGGGYWVATADGAVYPFGDALYDGSMVGVHLNAPIIAAVGW